MGDNSVRGQFLWHELMTRDPRAAVAFYTRVVGWDTQSWDQQPDYTLLTYKGAPMAGVISPPPEARAMGAPSSWTTYIGVDDVHVTAWDAQRLGAKVLRGPEKTPSVGTWAILQDPQGAVFAIHQPDQKPAGGAPGIGDFSWHELATTDHVAAFAFYQKLFGWKKTGSFDMGPDGTYIMFGPGKTSVAGVYTKGSNLPGQPAWLPYVRVPDVKPIAKLIPGAGGTVVNAPMQVPDGTWIVVAKDPQGVRFALHSVPTKAKPTPKKAKSARKPSAKKAKTKKKGGTKVIRRTAARGKKAKTSVSKKTRRK